VGGDTEAIKVKRAILHRQRCRPMASSGMAREGTGMKLLIAAAQRDLHVLNARTSDHRFEHAADTAASGDDPHRAPPIHTAGQRPFEGYQDQPDTAERVRLEVQSLPFGLPEKMLRTGLDSSSRWPEAAAPAAEVPGFRRSPRVSTR
jgi:hypothetical protein